MRTHIVKQGECLSSLAARFGFLNWKQLYDHPANAKLRQKRPNPNILAPGDEVAVPEPASEKKVSVPTTNTYIFQLKLEEVRLRIAPHPVPVVDALGAGDSFAAGFLTGIVKGWDLEKTARFANAVGALSVTALGASTGIRTLEETLSFMEHGL